MSALFVLSYHGGRGEGGNKMCLCNTTYNTNITWMGQNRRDRGRGHIIIDTHSRVNRDTTTMNKQTWSISKYNTTGYWALSLRLVLPCLLGFVEGAICVRQQIQKAFNFFTTFSFMKIYECKLVYYRVFGCSQLLPFVPFFLHFVYLLTLILSGSG